MSLKLDTLLVGVDLTPPSLEGAAWTARAFAPESRLILAHALETHPILRFFSPSDAERKTEEVRAEVGARLAELRAEFGADRVEVRFADGAPGVELAKLAEELNVDAISVGAHREGAGGLLGSVLSTLLGHATVPVLLAHGLGTEPPHRILVAVDESDTAGPVLAWAGAMAERFDATGNVITVIESPAVPVDTALFSSEEEYRQARDEVVARARRHVLRRMNAEGIDLDRFTAESSYGRPEERILEAADRFGADLIVLGTHGATHRRALMVGSVSRRVIEASKCPVFVVPPSTSRG